jgi:segregation and condensation protein B
MSNIDRMEDNRELKASLEALLFVSPVAVTPSQLASALEIPESEVEAGLKLLAADFQERGLRLQRHAGRVQLTTAPELSEVIERFLGLEITSHLSRAALETLSIVAYQQPVTRPQVDSIRGVNSDGVMKSLLHKGLIQDIGRAEGPGRPILYVSSAEFLQHFGLASLEELPPLEVDQDGEPHQEIKD